MNKVAVITGVTGQDGAYLASYLLSHSYKVVGAVRRTSTPNFWRLRELGVDRHPNFSIANFDLLDHSSARSLLDRHEPDEIYNLAAQSFVATSFEQPLATSQISGIGVLGLLEAIRMSGSKTRFYQASTSEMFGKVQQIPQSETTPFYPRSPYGVSKLYAHWMNINYREGYGIFGSNGILFNHESPLRGLEFVTRKITDGVARIALGRAKTIELGNLDAKRDWGFAGDFVKGMHLILQASKADDYVLATGRTESIRNFTRMAFSAADIDIEFAGSGSEERAIDKVTGETVVVINPRYYRPAEVDLLVGDPAKAKKELGWEPECSLEQLCEMMVRADLARLEDSSA